MFHYKVALWECECAMWHEATGVGQMPLLPESLNHQRFTMRRWGAQGVSEGWPNVRLYVDMVCEYTERQLTYEEDGLQAISGLISRWNNSFHGGFIWGLPQMFFDEALLSQPAEPMVSRTQKSQPRSNYVTIVVMGRMEGKDQFSALV